MVERLSTDPVPVSSAPTAATSGWRQQFTYYSARALRYGMIAVFAAMVIATAILDSTFLDQSNLLNLLLEWAPVGLMAIGMTFVIIAGGFDLSVGGTYAGAACLYSGLVHWGSTGSGRHPRRTRRGHRSRHRQRGDHHASRRQPVRRDARYGIHAARPGAGDNSRDSDHRRQVGISVDRRRQVGDLPDPGGVPGRSPCSSSGSSWRERSTAGRSTQSVVATRPPGSPGSERICCGRART